MSTPSEQEQRLIVQVVPPGEGGVRDYMACLAEQWSAAGTVCRVIALSASAVRQKRLATRLAELASPPGPAEPIILVLHFSGYGYHARGLCAWLVEEVAHAQHALGGRLKLAVVFHELFARGEPPWRSAFWLSPLQAAAARRLARLADVVWTNTEHHAAWLRDALPAGSTVHAWPVFSNVGEPRDLPEQSARAPRAILFGSVATRRRALDGLRRCGAPLLERLGVEELVEVGPGGSVLTDTSTPIRFRQCAGNLPRAQVSALLAASRFGLIEYPSNLLGKSGVFAAYAAHGCLVVNARAGSTAADDLVPGEHYIAPEHAAPQQGAERLHAWYLQHAMARQADVMHRLLSASG